MSSVVTCSSPTRSASFLVNVALDLLLAMVIDSKAGFSTGLAVSRSSPTALSTNGAKPGLSSQWKAVPSLPQPHHFMCLTGAAGEAASGAESTLAGASLMSVIGFPS
jgi:hypothetical protein